ncbi:MAG TPA: cytochrome c [Gammaproteobacteria bacterium]|nr:cytochrome c [Gammaproteobacteria bacterium]
MPPRIKKTQRLYTALENPAGFSRVILFCIVLVAPIAAQAENTANDQLKRGELVYQRFCSLCHGVNLEGQKNWRIRKPDGKLPAPPHDETGHTWHHADELLFGITKQGLVPPYAPPDYKSDMPAWGNTLSDDDIWAVIAYIKSRWPEETRKIQADINNEALQRQRK